MLVKNKEIKIGDIFTYIESKPMAYSYEIYCRILTDRGFKKSVFFRKPIRLSTLSKIKSWIKKTPNYSSFYLNEVVDGVVVEKYRIQDLNS